MKLAYYTHLLPIVNKLEDGYGGLSDATVFDCRQIPISFLDDTGDAVFEEMRALKSKIALPHPTCYFEFADQQAALAVETGISVGSLTQEAVDNDDFSEFIQEDDHIYVYTFHDWYSQSFEKSATHPQYVIGGFTNGVKINEGDNGFFGLIHCYASDEYNKAWTVKHSEILDSTFRWCDQEKEHRAERMSRRTLAVISLLNERLLASHYVPDTSPKVTAIRARQGKLPLSGDHHILTINVAAVRRVAKSSNLTHESPSLHWRRGHWRILHRSSEFEDKTWIKRCLVGDPARGFVHKDYRVIWLPSMIPQTEPEIADQREKT